MAPPEADRLEESWWLVAGAAGVTLVAALAVPAALALRAVGPRPEVAALGAVVVTGPLFVRAGRPPDARLAPGDPPSPSPADLFVRPPNRP
jgi:hypothetical protein